MQIGKSFGIGANLACSDNILLGIHAETGECSGCGGDVHILKIGLLFGEIYFTHHAH